MDLTHPANCLTFNMQRAARSLMRGFEAAANESGLTAPQFATLSLLSGFGEQTLGELAERMGTDRTTLTRNLAIMARQGWIAEVEATDNRLRILCLSDAGREVLASAFPIWQRFQSGLVERIGADKAADLLATLKTI